MGKPTCTTLVSGRFGVSLFSELLFVQDKQRFALLSFNIDKICHISVPCFSAMFVMIYFCIVFHYQIFLNYDSINRLKNKINPSKSVFYH